MLHKKNLLELNGKYWVPSSKDYDFFLNDFCESCIKKDSCKIPIALDVVISEDAFFYMPQFRYFSYGDENERYNLDDLNVVVCEDYKSFQKKFNFMPENFDAFFKLQEIINKFLK